MQQSCIGEIKKEYPQVYPELVNRQEMPTTILLKEAMTRRGLPYKNELKLEGNCMQLLEHLGLREQLDAELTSAKQVAGAAKQEEEDAVPMEIEDMLMEIENEPELVPISVKSYTSRPPMKEPDFLIRQHVLSQKQRKRLVKLSNVHQNRKRKLNPETDPEFDYPEIR